MRTARPGSVVLLGPQRLTPTLREPMVVLGVDGTVATVTAGWQEREEDDRELHEYLGGRSVNLRLHSRGEDVFRADRELAEAYRVRQDTLRQLQELYRVRLEYALDAAAALVGRTAAPDILDEERRSAIEAVRMLDQHHLSRCRDVHAAFEVRWRPTERAAVVRHREEIARLVGGAAAVAIAGGHVAVLLNRLKLFGIAELAGGRPVFAWSAGAMAVSERVVLFHDNPPQGAAVAEILDTGLGLCTGIVPLPDPKRRLRLDDRDRVSTYARRFAPSACVAMTGGAWIAWDGEFWHHPTEVVRLGEGGDVEAMPPHWAAPRERRQYERRR